VVAMFHAPSTDPYIVLDRLVLDANRVPDSNGLVCRDGTHHVRFQRGMILNSFYETVFFQQSDTCEVLQSDISGNQRLAALGITNTKNTRLEGNSIHDGAGHGIWDTYGVGNTGFVIARNRIRQMADAGVQVGPGPGWQVVNNIVTGNKLGVQVLKGATGTKVTNNTIFGNTAAGVQIETGATQTALVNTLLFGNTPPLVNNGSGTTQLTNLTTDPLYTNPAGGDFTLQPASPGIDKGSAVAGITVDFLGQARPQGAGYDIGAYETAGTTQPPAHVGTPRAVQAVRSAAGTEVTVTWQGPLPMATDLPPTGYSVERSLSAAGAYQVLGRTNAQTLTWVDSSVTSMQALWYRVRTVAMGQPTGQEILSDPSPTVSVPAQPPPVGQLACTETMQAEKVLVITCTLP